MIEWLLALIGIATGYFAVIALIRLQDSTVHVLQYNVMVTAVTGVVAGASHGVIVYLGYMAIPVTDPAWNVFISFYVLGSLGIAYTSRDFHRFIAALSKGSHLIQDDDTQARDPPPEHSE